MGIFGILSARGWASLGALVAVAAFLGWGAVSLVDSTRAACEGEHASAALQAQKQDHANYLAAVAWGSQISAQLAQTQRRLNYVKTEYLAYAGGIAGNCPAGLGLLIDAAATGQNLPAAAGAPVDPAAQIAAAAIGTNIAENYARCLANAAQLAALIEWHREEEAVK